MPAWGGGGGGGRLTDGHWTSWHGTSGTKWPPGCPEEAENAGAGQICLGRKYRDEVVLCCSLWSRWKEAAGIFQEKGRGLCHKEE